MKLCTRLLAIALLAAPAMAAEQVIQLNATVPSFCKISGTDSPAAVIQDLTIGADGRVVTSPISLTLPVSCNKPATLALASANNGLTGPAAASNYANKINYTVTTDGVFSTELNTQIPAAPVPGVTPYSAISSAAFNGDVNLSIVPFTTALPLVSGNYTDTLRVTVTPNQ